MNIDELNEIFKNTDENMKKVVQSMFPDFIYEIEQLGLLKPEIEKIGIPTSKAQAEKKRYLIKEYSDISQRHDSKIKIFLSTLNKSDVGEESNLVKLLKGFE